MIINEKKYKLCNVNFNFFFIKTYFNKTIDDIFKNSISVWNTHVS